MEFALYGKKKIKVKVLGTEEGKYHIEFEIRVLLNLLIIF